MTSADPAGLVSAQRTVLDVPVRITYADGRSVTELCGPGLAHYLIQRWTHARFVAQGDAALCFVEEA